VRIETLKQRKIVDTFLLCIPLRRGMCRRSTFFISVVHFFCVSGGEDKADLLLTGLGANVTLGHFSSIFYSWGLVYVLIN
jgi:hypothetical protein